MAAAGVLLSAIKYFKHLRGVQQPSLHTKQQVSREQIGSETLLLVTDTNLALLMMLKASRLCRAVTCSHGFSPAAHVRGDPGSRPTLLRDLTSITSELRGAGAVGAPGARYVTVPGTCTMPWTWRPAKRPLLMVELKAEEQKEPPWRSSGIRAGEFGGDSTWWGAASRDRGSGIKLRLCRRA